MSRIDKPIDSTFPMPNGLDKLVLTGPLAVDFAESEAHNKQVVISHYSRNRPTVAERLADNWFRNEICIPAHLALKLLEKALHGLWFIEG